jgi:membrane fusion protein, multidrug efflux system
LFGTERIDKVLTEWGSDRTIDCTERVTKAIAAFTNDAAPTDDAQIDGYVYPVSSRISGYVTQVLVDDNQYVKPGTVLVQLDPKDYDVAVANAKAALVDDSASTAALSTNVPLTSVDTSSQLSSSQASVEDAKAGVVAAQHQLDAAKAALEGYIRYSSKLEPSLLELVRMRASQINGCA